MPQTYSREHLSGDPNGQGLVLGTSIAQTTVHTIPAKLTSPTRQSHEVWIYVVNNDSVDRLVTVGWADTTQNSPWGGGSKITFSVKKSSGLNLLIAGLLISQHPTVPLHINMYSNGTSLVVYGYINKIITAA